VGLRFWPEGEYVTRIVVIIFLLFMFVFALDYLGFVLTTFLFMFSLLKLIESRKLRTLFLIAGLTTVLSYAIFELWLKANLPKGFLGF
jgi:putative tricarboxylic transport membrane protein